MDRIWTPRPVRGTRDAKSLGFTTRMSAETASMTNSAVLRASSPYFSGWRIVSIEHNCAARRSSRLVPVSNDTGVAHLCAVVGASLVLVMDRRGTLTFMPLTEKIRVVRSGTIDEITVDEVFSATESFLK